MGSDDPKSRGPSPGRPPAAVPPRSSATPTPLFSDDQPRSGPRPPPPPPAAIMPGLKPAAKAPQMTGRVDLLSAAQAAKAAAPPTDFPELQAGQVFVPEQGCGEPLLVARTLGKGGAGFAFEVIPVRSAMDAGGLDKRLVDRLGKTDEVRVLMSADEMRRDFDIRRVAGLRRVLKVLRSAPGHPNFDSSYARMQEEIQIYCRISGTRGFPALISCGLRPYLHMVLEYIPGKALSAHLTNPKRRRDDGFLHWDFVYGFWFKFLRIPGFLHRHGIVHRDIKPDNVILREDPMGGGSVEPVLLDLGVARDLQENRRIVGQLTGRLNMIWGTPKYVAPEQVGLENVAVSPRTDIFALGRMLFEMLFQGDPLAHIRDPESMTEAFNQPLPDCIHPGLSEAQRSQLQDLYRSMCARDPTQRPADTDVVLEKLRHIHGLK